MVDSNLHCYYRYYMKAREPGVTPIGNLREVRIPSWEETVVEMAAASEDWSDWYSTIADGLDEIEWK